MKLLFITPGLLEAASKRGGGIEEIDLQVGIELSEDMDVEMHQHISPNRTISFQKSD